MAADAEQRRDLAGAIQKAFHRNVNYVIGGQFSAPMAYRSNLEGVIPFASPVFWRMDRKQITLGIPLRPRRPPRPGPRTFRRIWTDRPHLDRPAATPTRFRVALTQPARGLCLDCGAFGTVERVPMHRFCQRRSILAAMWFGLLAAAAGPVAAAAPPPAELTPQDKAELERIAAYLNNIHTMTAVFQQRAGNGASAGHLWISRPGRMKFEYDPPNPISLYADGFYIYYWDKDLHQVSRIALKVTPAWFLLRDKISFTDVIVTGIERAPNTIRVSVVENAQPDAGSLTMTFSGNPLALRQWTVVDQEGKTTMVSLSDVQFGMAIDPNVFLFHDPYAQPRGEP